MTQAVKEARDLWRLSRCDSTDVLLHSTTSQVFKQSLDRTFRQIQRRTRLHEQTPADVREVPHTQNRPGQPKNRERATAGLHPPLV